MRGLRIFGVAAISVAVGWTISRVIRRRVLDEVNEAALPPGSLGLPYIGETLSYSKNPHKFFEDRVQKYGPVFKTRILGDPVVCFTGPDAFDYFVNSPDFSRDGANPSHVQDLLAHHSLPLLEGMAHRNLRTPLLKVFEPEAVPDYLAIVEKVTSAYIAEWEQKTRFEWIDEFKRLSASLCDSLFLGAEPGTGSDELRETLEDFMAGLATIPINLPGTTLSKALKARDRLVELIDRAIADHRSRDCNDVLSYLLKAIDAHGTTVGEEYLRAQMVHNFFAAYGGIFRTLSLMCMDLAKYPDARDKVRDEVLSVTPSGAVTLDDLNSLNHLDNLTREVRRHNPIFASTFFEWVTKDVDYEGFRIPKGWKATGGVFSTLQSDDAFDGPTLFHPERFENHGDEGYVPHGGGPMTGHRCPAEDFSTDFMKTVAVLLLRDYDWRLTSTDLTLNDEPSPMPRKGINVEFTRR